MEHFRQVGNAGGTGDHLALMSRGERTKVTRILQNVGYIVLANLVDFQVNLLQPPIWISIHQNL
jgi:uncharacterized 2Fe-2S/4Fe-4S cluster protein (DUF4445 family)